MPLTKDQKKEIVKHLQSEFEDMKGMVLVDYKGVQDTDIKTLRNNAKEANVTYKVCKKTLLQKAFDELGIDINTKSLEGQIAYAISSEDEVAPAKIMAEFAKDHEELTILTGTLEKNVLTKEEIEDLAKLPSQDQLRGQLVGTLQAPISGFVNVLAGNIKNLITVLSAVKDQKGES